MKKMLLALALMGILAFPRQAKANGLTTCEIGISTAAVVVCASGTASLFAVVIDSVTAANDWTVVYDSNSISGYTFGTVADGTLTAPRVSEVIVTTAITTGGTEPNAGALQPRNMANGIVVNKKSANDVIRVLYTKP